MRSAALLLALLLILGVAATPGCSSQTTTTTRTVERPSDSGDERSGEKEVTVTETKETSGGGPGIGILSGTVRAIGFVLALPFKIIGGLLTIIF